MMFDRISKTSIIFLLILLRSWADYCPRPKLFLWSQVKLALEFEQNLLGRGISTTTSLIDVLSPLLISISLVSYLDGMESNECYGELIKLLNPKFKDDNEIDNAKSLHKLGSILGSMKNFLFNYRVYNQPFIGIKLYIINNLYHASNITLTKKYSTTVSQLLLYNIAKRNFSEPLAFAKVNKEINRLSKKNVRTDINEIQFDKHLKALNLNVLFWKASWEESFDKRFTSRRSFTQLDGTNMNILMMSSLLKVKYLMLKTLHSQLVIINYKHHSFKMAVILPNVGIDVRQVYAMLANDTEKFMVSLSQATPSTINVTLPRIVVEETLSSNSIWSPQKLKCLEKQRFTHMFKKQAIETPSTLHKIQFKVVEDAFNRREKLSQPKIDIEYGNFLANRPFIYMIYEKESGAILIWGIYKQCNNNC